MASLLKSKISNAPSLDFEDLESRFQIHKYYPKYFHNYDYSTPVIKDLIADKPIYAKANEHVKHWRNPADLPGKKPRRKAMKDEYRAIKKELKDEQRELRKEHREEEKSIKHDLKHERREVRRELHNEKRELRREYKDAKRGLRTKSSASSENGGGAGATETLYKRWDQPLADPVPMRRTESRYPDDRPPSFSNPFDSTASTLVPQESSSSTSRSAIKTRNNSIASKFKSLMKHDSNNHNHDHNNSDSSPSRKSSLVNGGGADLQPSLSFDQTKSNMTMSRTKCLLNKLKVGDRRMSEQIGTYYRGFFYFF